MFLTNSKCQKWNFYISLSVLIFSNKKIVGWSTNVYIHKIENNSCVSMWPLQNATTVIFQQHWNQIAAPLENLLLFSINGCSLNLGTVHNCQHLIECTKYFLRASPLKNVHINIFQMDHLPWKWSKKKWAKMLRVYGINILFPLIRHFLGGFWKIYKKIIKRREWNYCLCTSKN